MTVLTGVAWGKTANIEAVEYHRVALTAEENQEMITSTPDDEFVITDKEFQAKVDVVQKLPIGLRPSLKNGAKGVFSISVQNRGENLATTVLTFDLESKEETPQEGLIDVSLGLTTQSLAVLPFIDIFKPEIEKRAAQLEKAFRRMQGGKTPQAASDDINALEVMRNLYRLSDEKNKGRVAESRPEGKEALCDCLAVSLSASNDFYDVVWGALNESYESAIQYVAERCATGEITLDMSQEENRLSRSDTIITPWQVRAKDGEGDGITKPKPDERYSNPTGHIRLAPAPEEPK